MYKERISLSSPPQVKYKNKWGSKEFAWGGKKIFAPFAREKSYRPR